MYAQFEAAGLIVGTDEWEELQERKLWQGTCREGDTYAGRERDIGQAVPACGGV